MGLRHPVPCQVAKLRPPTQHFAYMNVYTETHTPTKALSTFGECACVLVPVFRKEARQTLCVGVYGRFYMYANSRSHEQQTSRQELRLYM